MLCQWNFCEGLLYELQIAKLRSYGFSLNAFRLIHNYLSNRRQKIKINKIYSSWEEILFGVLQRSILGPLLFHVFMCDLFFTADEIDFASYADDNTLFLLKKHHQSFLTGFLTIKWIPILISVIYSWVLLLP